MDDIIIEAKVNKDLKLLTQIDDPYLITDDDKIIFKLMGLNEYIRYAPCTLSELSSYFYLQLEKVKTREDSFKLFDSLTKVRSDNLRKLFSYENFFWNFWEGITFDFNNNEISIMFYTFLRDEIFHGLENMPNHPNKKDILGYR